MLGPGLALGAFALAVVAGAVLGAAQVVARRNVEESDPGQGEEEYDEEPESVGSLLKCGVGYLVLVDVVALFVPSLNRSWFGDSPEELEAGEDDWQPSLTTIPFGPYLVVGALVAATFPEPLLAAGKRYLEWATGVR